MRHGPRNPFTGSIVASLAAGPVTALAASLVEIASDPATVDPFSAGQLFGIGIMLLIPATLVALLPNLTGTALMLWIGRHVEATRLPILWALVGAAAFGVPFACGGGVDGYDAALTCALVGATCAAICRAWAYWPEEAERSARRNFSTTPQAINACPAK